MADNWSGGSSGGASGWGNTAAKAPAKSGGGGHWWNPLHDIQSAYNYVKPAQFVRQLSSGIAQGIARPVYGTALGIGQGIGSVAYRATGNDAKSAALGTDSMNSFLHAATGVTDPIFGAVEGASNLGSTIATAAQLGGQYNSTIGKGVSRLGSGVSPLLSPEMGADAKQYVPQSIFSRARKEGLASALVQDVGAVAVLGGGAAAAAGRAGAAATETAAAAAEAGDFAGQAAAEAKAATAGRIQSIAEQVAHPYKFAGIKTADFLEANRLKAYPGPEALAAANVAGGGFTDEQMASAASAGLSDLAQTSPDAALNPTRSVLTDASNAAADNAPTVTLPGDAAEMAAARSMMAPEVAAAESMGAGSELAQNAAEGHTGASEGTLEASSAVDEAVQEARASQKPTYVEDQLGRRLNTPAPAWAQRAAQALPDIVNRALAHLTVPIDRARVWGLARDMTRYTEIAQNQARRTDATRAGTLAADQILAARPDLTRITAAGGPAGVEQMVGEEIAARLNGTQLATEFVRATGKVATPEQMAALTAAAKRGYRGIPDDVYEALSTEQRTTVDQAINTAVEEHKSLAAERLQTLLAGRHGARGLESAILPEGEMPMTAEQNRLYRRTMQDFRRADVLKTRAPRERQTLQRNLDEAVTGASKASEQVAKLQERLGFTESTITSLHNGVPPGLRNVDATVATIRRGVAEQGSFTADVAKGSEAVPTPGVHVTLADQFDVPSATFTAVGDQLLRDAIHRPVNATGDIYDASSLWGGPDAHLTVREYFGPDGTPRIKGSIELNTAAGNPLTELQATMLGEAYKQPSVYDPAANAGQGGTISLSGDANIQNLYAAYASDILNPRSSLSRVADEMISAAGAEGVNITAADVNAELRNLMQWDHSLNEMRPAEHPLGKLFDSMETKVSSKLPTSAHLAQTVRDTSIRGAEALDDVRSLAETLRRDYARGGQSAVTEATDGLLLDTYGYGTNLDDVAHNASLIEQTAATLSDKWGTVVNPADVHAMLLEYARGDVARLDAGRLLSHHDMALNDLSAVEQAVNAGGQVDPQTFDPFGDFFDEQGITPKGYPKRLAKWQADIGQGKFAQVASDITTYMLRLRRGEGIGRYEVPPDSDVLHGNTGELYQRFHDQVRGVTMVDAGSTGRLLIRLYQNADLTTLLHENAHLLRQILPAQMLDELAEAYPSIEGRLPSGTLTVARVADEEKFVNDLMTYIRAKVRGGDVPTAHAATFDRIASLMEDDYTEFLKTSIGRTLPNDIVNFWDRMYNPEIVAPDVLHDPLSAQYAPVTTGVNTKKFRWETDAQYSQRTRQYGEARARKIAIERDIARANARAAKADDAIDRMNEIIGGPTRSEQLAAKLEARGNKTLARIDEQMDRPNLTQTPVEWHPIMAAFHEIADIAKADKTGALAEVIGEIPETFSQVMRYASENGFEPTHVPDLTWQQANKYLFGHMKLTGEAEVAGLRQTNKSVLSREGLNDHSLTALGAANVAATREYYQGRLVNFIEDNYAEDLPQGQEPPKGWKPWDPEKRSIILGKNKEGETVATATTKVVPEAVARALGEMRKDYTAWPFRFAQKGTGVWKTLILTYSASWYIMNFVGNLTNALIAGVKPADFLKTWKQFRRDELPDMVQGRDLYSSMTNEGHAGTLVKRNKLSQLPDVIRAEGVRVATREFNAKLRNVERTTDALTRAAVFNKYIREGAPFEEAVTKSYEALGDFGNLSPFERGVVTAIIPFYAFAKSMFKLMARMPADHPLATGIFLQLGRMNQAYLENKYGAVPDSLVGSGVFNNRLVGYAKFTPLAQTYRSVTPQGIAQSFNPYLKLFLAEALGAPVFNGRAAMGSYGQLVQRPDIGSSLVQMYTQTPGAEAVQNASGDSLARFFGKPRTYTDKETQALMKRIAKTQQGIKTVNGNGGYLTLDAVGG